MKGLTPMRRALVFMLLGPTLIALTVCLIVIGIGGLCAVSFALIGAAIAFLFACLISAVAKPIDGYLVRAVPIRLRVPLIAIIGAAIATVSILTLIRVILPFPSLIEILSALWLWGPFAIAGAYCAGLCSVLSGDPSRETWATP